ncbi:MAG: hypothetical protein A2Z29_00805 [Chloroflexi bacterium RBG_16_56_11]|nr:MAG: hypothetical protein A2Z29_00805 [Chloroflexi bacterium RBG_16_56_11]
MKKGLVFLALVVIIVASMLITSCAEEETTAPTVTSQPTVIINQPTTTTTAPQPTATTTKPPTSTTAPQPTPTAPQPVRGGILRIITPAGPTVLGGPRGGPGDLAATFPGMNALLDAAADRSKGNGLEPVLATSVDEDLAGKRLVIHLRKGVKFHDGTEMTADVCLFWHQYTIDTGRFWGLNLFDGMAKIDDYTYELRFKSYSNMLIQNWVWFFPTSMDAFVKGTGGSTDPVVQREWQETNVVGAGPFKLVEWVRDNHMEWTRFDDYWQKDKGLPYLDGVYYRYIPDAVTARALMEAGQADYWMAATARDQKELLDKGFKRISGWVGLVMDIYPNTSDPASDWNNRDLRYALEYALDKAAIAQALGAGLYPPLYQLAPPGEWGYDPNYPERRYDVAKAKEYLAKAGYPNGYKTTLLIGNDTAAQDAGTAIKGYLDAAGIETTLDIADPGRLAGLVWGSPQPGLAFYFSGMDITNLLTYMRWFSTDPFANVRYLGRTEEQKVIDDEAKSYPDAAGQKIATEKAFKYMNDEARLIPVYQIPSASMAQSYVHSQQFQQGFVRWQMELIWMEKH